nr:hypothetical protein HUO10_001018 [Paraburkholderia busanensis]
MKIRILSLVCVTSAASLLAGCMAVYKNSDACEQLMRSKLAETSSDTLKIDHTGAGIAGSRVVVEGTIEHVMTASEVAAATPPTAAKTVSASAASAASGAAASSAAVAAAASGARVAPAGASAAGSAAGVSDAAATSTESAASGVSGASSVALASSFNALSLKSTKPKKTTTPAAAECTFHGPTLGIFTWLAPAKLATPPAETTE